MPKPRRARSNWLRGSISGSVLEGREAHGVGIDGRRKAVEFEGEAEMTEVDPGERARDRRSRSDFVDNQVQLQLSAWAHNMGDFLRQAVRPRAVRHWTLTTSREKLIKIGAKVVCHARQVIFQMAEVAMPRERFREHPRDNRASAADDTINNSQV